MLVWADTTKVATGTVLNLYTLQKKQLINRSVPPCSLNTDTLKRYDFVYEYQERCMCICPCCPAIRITSPRPFYRSKAPMSTTTMFSPAMLRTQFTEISGPDTSLLHNGWIPCRKLPSVNYEGANSGLSFLDSIKSRMFVFLSDNGGKLPYCQYMIVNISPITGHIDCNPNYPSPGVGGQYPVYDSVRIIIYNSQYYTANKPMTPVFSMKEPKDPNLYTISGTRIRNSRIGELSAGVYVVNGRLRFLQKNAPMNNAMNVRRQ